MIRPIFQAKKGYLSYTNFGAIRLKYSKFYHMYSNSILHKGKVLRIERRFSFLDNQPTVTMFENRIEKMQFEKAI
jgi:hypothetical protein